MTQFGEKVKLLTDSTKESLSVVVNLDVMKYFRNLIDHDYESTNKVVLAVYIGQLVSDTFLKALRDRAIYCKNKRR